MSQTTEERIAELEKNIADREDRILRHRERAAGIEPEKPPEKTETIITYTRADLAAGMFDPAALREGRAIVED